MSDYLCGTHLPLGISAAHGPQGRHSALSQLGEGEGRAERASADAQSV
jgi:hypothetical protein